MKEPQKKQSRKHSSVSLRIHLLISFGMFLLVTVVVLYLFQIVLLNVLYEQIQRKELREASDRLVGSVETGEEIGEAAFILSADKAISVYVYQIRGTYATEILRESGRSYSGPLMIAPERLAELYNEAKQTGGSYSTKVTFGGHEIRSGFWSELFSGFDADNDFFAQRRMVDLIHIRLCSDGSGTEYMIVLVSSFAPMTSTVNTLRRQFSLIVLILFVASVLIAIVLCRRILRPIRRMNEAAASLAKGKYNVNFEGENGYRELQELAKTLNYAAEELSRTDRLQKELIANISHDLRTPLTMIRAYSEAMRDIPGENTAENIQIVIDETERLSTLVNDLLDVSRIQSGIRLPQMEQFDLLSAVQEVLTRYEAFIRMQGYTLLLDVRGCDHAEVFADRGMLLQVVYNLINNAINYTGADKTVRTVLTVRRDTVRVEICDTGEGIAPEEIPRIWDRYYKVDKVHRRAQIGTGLGLSIVKGILELHHAMYGVESEKGKGSIFWFELPLIPEKLSLPAEKEENP